VDEGVPEVVVAVPDNEVILLLVQLYARLRTASRWTPRHVAGFALQVLVHLEVQGVLLAIPLPSHALVGAHFFLRVVVIAVLSAKLLALGGSHWFAGLTAGRIALLPVGIDRLLIGWLLHDPDGFVVVKVPWFLVGVLRNFGRLFAGDGIVVFSFDVAFGSIVCLFIGPAQGEGAGSSGGLHDLFVGLSVKISVVCDVLVEHLQGKIMFKFSMTYLISATDSLQEK
jgi:hypothetical protein